MSHFLVVYDREPGQLIRLERHDSNGTAMQARFRAEAEFHGRPRIEIVVLAAASEQDLMRTHGRYFLDLDELAARMSSAA